MNETLQTEKFDIKKSVKISFKTLLDCFVIIMLLMCSIFVLLPKTSLKIHETFGNKRIQELNYKMIYTKSNNIVDLYNLIIFESGLNNYNDELFYIDKMISRADYESFCKEFDGVSAEKISDEGLTLHSANVNGYLLGRKVICMYNLKENGLETYVYRQTKTGKLSEYIFSSYVDLVYFDKTLSQAEKKEKLSCIMDTMDGVNGKLSDLIQTRVDGLKTAIAISDSDKKDVLRYTLMRIYASRFYVYDTLGDEELKNENHEAYKEIKAQLGK